MVTQKQLDKCKRDQRIITGLRTGNFAHLNIDELKYLRGFLNEAILRPDLKDRAINHIAIVDCLIDNYNI